ncbi:MAG: 4Fe-4S dicluster domain-containing protein [Lysobacter sp.]|nr:4Fe-4S dicluster domain-containing protein [Lysobacter sp.]
MTIAPPCAAVSTVSLQALADQCVQCGLCLPSCPTYALDPIEAESPRGRIALAKAWEAGLSAPTETGDLHLDHCLGCRRCEAVCPAGVRYGALLTAVRSRQHARRPAGLRQRTSEWLTARPRALSVLMAAYRGAWPLLPRAARPLPRPPVSPIRPQDPYSESASDAALFLGCLARSYETPLYAAVHRLGGAIGLTFTAPTGQTCCGSLHAHAGATEQATSLAATNRKAFAGASTVLSLASGCHDTLADSLRGQAVVRDAIDVIAEGADRLRFAARPERVALHLPCTQRNVVRSDAALRTLLARVPALEVVVLDAGFGCCGAAGTRMLTDPVRAARFRQPLLDQLAASSATRLLSANIGCRLHLANGTSLPVQHPLEFLSECLA